MSLVIVDANGDIIHSVSQNTKSLTWPVPTGIQNGSFKYQVTVSDVLIGSRQSRDQATKSRPVISKKSGALMINQGSLVMPASEGEAVPDGETGRFSLSESFGNVAQLAIEWLIPAANADIVQQDDVIIVGSSCVGLDCVNGENFGFDTLVVKENNVRILFNDTSTSASFPKNDWRLIANDTANGGGNFFSIEDATAARRIFTLDAGAPTNSLYVDSTGRIGIGTSNPATLLDLVNGNTPTVRLNQDSSSGWLAQAWDLGGNEAGFFVRDATNGSKIPFRIATNAPTNTLTVANNGRVGIGTLNPTEELHVMGDAIISGNLELGSSRFIKNDIKDLGISQAMHAFQALEPVMFKYNSSPEKQSIGFIAEDVPDLVATENRNSLRPMDIVAVLTKVVQEQQKTIENLSKKIDSLIDEK